MSDETTILDPPAAEPTRAPPSPPKIRARWPLFLVGLLLGVVAGPAALYVTSMTGVFDLGPGKTDPMAPAPASSKPRYHCPMHPTYTSDRPGDCPICGMKLVPIEGDHAGGDHAGAAPADGATPTTAEADPDAEDWQCPQHPTYTAPGPGTCLVCGEKLVPVPGSQASKAPERKIVGWRSPMDPKRTSPVPMKDEMGMDFLPIYEAAPSNDDAKGFAGVTIDAERQQLIGLRTADVAMGPVGRVWRTSGRVVVDETRVRKVNVKVEGFVERLHVDFVGRPVKRGEALLEMYSPEVMAAQYELLLAARTEQTLNAAALGDDPALGGNSASKNPSLLEPARQKLRLWDVPQGAIARVERSGQVTRTVTLTSPIAGVVTGKTVVQGSRLAPGDTPFEITDLSQVWVLADVYATEIGLVQKGQPATLWLQGRPDKPFQGQVEFLDPLVDEKTRTVRVRLQFSNESGELRPGSFGEVEFRAGERDGLVIPTDAVIDSGTQKVVFLALPNGRFAPRVVQTGPAPGDRFEVTQGLQQGDKVVTRATFLVDSESRLKAALSAMSGGTTR